jgi:hypothetical protein
MNDSESFGVSVAGHSWNEDCQEVQARLPECANLSSRGYLGDELLSVAGNRRPANRSAGLNANLREEMTVKKDARAGGSRKRTPGAGSYSIGQLEADAATKLQ